jgi:hypothetical protein
MILTAIVAVAGVVGVVAWTRSGDDTPSREDEFVAAVRQAAPDTTSTLSDEDLLDTGRTNCEMAKKGTLAAAIDKAEQEAALLDVAPGEMTERMTLPVTYLCPQYADALDPVSTTAVSTTTAPPRTTTTTSAPTVDADSADLRANEVFGVPFGTPGDEAIAAISERVGAPAERQPIEGPGLEGEYVTFPDEISIIIGRTPGDTGPMRLIRWDTTGTWLTDKGIGVGSTMTEIRAAYPNVEETIGCDEADPPSLTVSNPPAEPDPIEFVLDPTGTTVTAMAAPAYNLVGC